MKYNLIKQYEQLHTQNPGFGTSANRMRPLIQNVVNSLEAKNVLDYGCGKSDLFQHIRNINNFDRYDPSIADINNKPIMKYDLVINTDVLEHIPENQIDALLGDIQKLGRQAYFTICTIPAVAILPNGDNAHCTVKPPYWWLKKIREFFPNAHLVTGYVRVSVTIVTWAPGFRFKITNYIIARHLRLKRFIRKYAQNQNPQHLKRYPLIYKFFKRIYRCFQ